MVTYQAWLIRFPQFAYVEEPLFTLLLSDAVLEMGSNESRWHNVYNVAQANLIAHNASLRERYESGDHTPTQPLRTKEVDDVQVEYAVSRNSVDNFDPYLSTSYGQQYVKWRRICFAGPRIA